MSVSSPNEPKSRVVENKMHKAFPLPVMEFSLPGEAPTASEESFQCQKERDVTVEKIALLLKSSSNCQSKSYDSYAKIQKYLQHEHYALWEVIEFGDSYEAPGNVATTGSTSDGTGKKRGRTVTLTTDDMQKRKNDVKERTTLLMSLPDEHQLRFTKQNSGNEEVNIASGSTASISVSTAGANIGIDEDDIEEMDIKWNMALLSMMADRAPRSQDRGRRDNYRQGSKVEEQAPKALMAIDGVGWDWSYMVNDKENHALIADEETTTEFALMANTIAESEVFDNSLCFKACKKNSDSLNSKITELTDKLYEAKNMIYHYKLVLAQVEARLAEHRSQELKYYEKIRVLEFNTESRANYIESLTKDLELLKKKKGELETKLTGFQTASKDLDSLLKSQRLDKNKEGLGYSVVLPPPAQVYSLPKKDVSWTGLSKFKDDNVTNYSRPLPAIESTSDDAQNRNPFVTKTEASPSTISPKPFIKFVKANDSPTKSKTDKVETAKKPPVKYAEHYRIPTKKPNNNTHKSFTPRPAVHKPYRPPMRPMRSNMNVVRPNRTSFNKPAHSYTKRPFQRTSAVRSQYRAPWGLTVNRNFPTVNRKFPTANRKFSTGSIKYSTTDMGKKENTVKASASHNNIDDKGYWDSGCSRHMIGNISYLSYYKPFDGGYVSFGQGGCKITDKGPIKTSKLKFENVYFVKDLKDFKLLDDANVLLRTPRQHNMYSIDLNNIVPHKDLTCLVAKASADKGMLWHRRLGHLNFKTMNRLVRYNLVRGLPSKCFENDHTCTACLKRKQHKASLETPIPTVACFTDSQEPSSDTRLISKRVSNQVETRYMDNILTLTNRFEDILGVTTNSDESNGVEADVSNMETTITASPTPTLRIHKDHPKSQIIGPVDTPIQTRNKSKEVGEQSFIATTHQKTDPALLQFCLFSCFLSQVGPKKISGALQNASWVEAMQEELLQFKIQNVWTLVDCPKGVRPIGIKWVLKNKKDERGIVIRNKARLVAQGHIQEEGIDYDEVFAPVARIKAIILFLAYASFMGFTDYQMDVKSAFLYGTIDEKVYVIQPPGFQDPEFPARVYKVEKAMYGLHQAPRAWAIPVLSCKYWNGSACHERLCLRESYHPLYALTFKPTVYVSHIQQFWSTARIETMEKETKILATTDGILRTVTESSLRRNLKLKDEEGISNISYLSNFKPFDGGYVSFGQGGCKITGKGTIKIEFRNKEMNDFCSQKGIKREFSNARTPQQNGVAERRNRTLIEAARTMLADAKLP
nr:putative ribonuclease H-like domain-containing protein [Tanacetum cinerariifolium]